MVRGTKQSFSATGYIEERLKTLRKKEPPQVKKYPPRKVLRLSEAMDMPPDNTEGYFLSSTVYYHLFFADIAPL